MKPVTKPRSKHALYEHYGPALLRKCQRVLQNRQDAEDVVHDLFVDIFAGKATSLDLPYLYRAATNRCLNLFRRQSTRSRLLERYDESLRGPVRIRHDDQAIGIDLLIKLSTRLGEKDCALIIYRYFDELSQQEIAALLGLSRRTVGRRLRRIESAIKQLLNEPASESLASETAQ